MPDGGKRKPRPRRGQGEALVRRFNDSAFTSRELLVSLIDRVELTADKQVIIHFHFRQMDQAPIDPPDALSRGIPTVRAVSGGAAFRAESLTIAGALCGMAPLGSQRAW